MSFLNEERLSLYDSLIKNYCLNHNDLLNKVYEILPLSSYSDNTYYCDDRDFFSINDNKIIIAYFSEDIIVPSQGVDQYITIKYTTDYCKWVNGGSTLIVCQQTIPKGYSLLFKFEGLNNYRILSHTPKKNSYEAYVLEQGYMDSEPNFILCDDENLFKNEPPEMFIGYTANDLNLGLGHLGYPDDSCSWGISHEWERFYIYSIDNTIPAGYNLFLQKTSKTSGTNNKAEYMLISSSNSSSGNSSNLPSGSEGQFMVYTNGSWQGQTITVGGSY